MNNDLNFRLARDQFMHLETAANFFASRPQANNCYAVTAAKRFQTRAEEVIEQATRNTLAFLFSNPRVEVISGILRERRVNGKSNGKVAQHKSQ